MPARLTPGLFLLALAAVIAACSTNSTTPSSGGIPGIGPNFATGTIYVANTTGQAIEIFAPAPAPSAIPQYAISGSSTTMNGPQYLAFDSRKNLYVTNYSPSQTRSVILQFATYATGNVVPVNQYPLASTAHPRGIATFTGGSSSSPVTGFVVAATNPGSFFTDELLVYQGGLAGALIAGSNTQLNVPTGVAAKGGNTYYVANTGSASITVYVTPVPSATPAPTPTPTPTPSGATPTPSPSTTPTPASLNIAPAETISGPATQLQAPMGIALDSAGNLYVADAGQPSPRILVFTAAQLSAPGMQSFAPSRTITSASLVNPVDVTVDASGTIYVVDQGNGTNTSKLLIFAAGASGSSTPQTIVALPGTDTGIALSP